MNKYQITLCKLDGVQIIICMVEKPESVAEIVRVLCEHASYDMSWIGVTLIKVA